MRNLNMDDGDEKIKGKKTCLPIILMRPLRTEYSSHYSVSESTVILLQIASFQTNHFILPISKGVTLMLALGTLPTYQ